MYRCSCSSCSSPSVVQQGERVCAAEPEASDVKRRADCDYLHQRCCPCSSVKACYSHREAERGRRDAVTNATRVAALRPSPFLRLPERGGGALLAAGGARVRPVPSGCNYRITDNKLNSPWRVPHFSSEGQSQRHDY